MIVGNFNPSGDDDSLCSVAYTPISIGSNLFFVANNGTNGCELWKTAGTTATTTLVADVNVGQASSSPRQLTAVGTRIYFVVQDNSLPASPANTYLFYSDSPYSSVTKVTLTGADAAPSPVYLTAVGTKLYFGASVAGVVTLYEHDGTGAASAGIKQTAVGPANLIMNAGTQPFIFSLGTSAIVRAAPLGGVVYDIYKSDSTAAITENPAFVKHINAVAANSSNPILFKNSVIGSTLFFSADDGTGVELWKTDGTLAGTTRVRNANGNGTANAASNPSQLTIVGTTMYFTATDNMPGDGGAELYVSALPWTNAQKLTFRSGNPRVSNMNALGSNLIFTMSEDGTAANSSIYKTDGTVGGTLRVRAPGGVAAPTFNNNNFGTLNGFLFFSFASNNLSGNQLYRTNGTVLGTQILKALNPSPFTVPVDEVAANDVKNFSIIGYNLIFPGNDGTSGTQLWSTDSTTANTIQISNFTPQDNSGSAPALLGVVGTSAYYVLRDATHGRTIYKVSQP